MDFFTVAALHRNGFCTVNTPNFTHLISINQKSLINHTFTYLKVESVANSLIIQFELQWVRQLYYHENNKKAFCMAHFS